MLLPKIKLRDLFWLVVVMAVALGWWMERTSTYWYMKRGERTAAQAGMRMMAAEVSLLEERERYKKLLEKLQQRGIEINVD